jgi:hypothetical protein
MKEKKLESLIARFSIFIYSLKNNLLQEEFLHASRADLAKVVDATGIFSKDQNCNFTLKKLKRKNDHQKFINKNLLYKKL